MRFSIGKKTFHKIIRWALGCHGLIHIAETAANMYEGAWISAVLSTMAGALMLAGATIHMDHSGKEGECSQAT